MAWQDYYREHLAKKLDEHGDIVPPWAKYPDYERYCLGWRMGAGEGWLCFCSVFLETLPTDYATRLAYLRRHPPAPLSWASHVVWVLRAGDGDESGEEEDESGEEEKEADIARLRDLGLVKSDAAFANWCALHGEGYVPDLFEESPLVAARDRTRVFAFWSRAHAVKPALPAKLGAGWSDCEAALRGDVGEPNLEEGLLTLAKFFCAGRVRTPGNSGSRRPTSRIPSTTTCTTLTPSAST